MKKLLSFLVLGSFLFAGSLWNEANSTPYGPIMAKNVGDILLINIDEYQMASQKADTQLRRNTGIKGNADLSWSQAASYLDAQKSADDRGGFGFSAENRFSGSGSTGRSSKLKGALATTIYKTDGSQFYIRGSKTIIVNNEEEEISLEGIVRQSDIQADNSIDSSKISNVVLKLKGYGDVSRDQEKGFFAQLFDWIF
ncbi:MAG: flagellar basal body L-ring protein FlgH [Candidatus Margulisbacteria bacterium]|nr:flagellar basal body L-ring protein FlgH [Candidatus Margulisiibacteriota bacterium]